MMDDAGYTQSEPFFIDNEELAGLTPEQCFVLGVEWQMMANDLEDGEGFDRPVHLRNVTRIKTLLVRRKRKFRCMPTMDKDWMNIEVADKHGRFAE